MKKIFFILSSEKFSGGEKVALDIAKNLYKNFNFVFFLPNFPQKELEEKLKNFNYFFPKKEGFLNLINDLIYFLKKEKPDIIHSHGIRAGFYVKLAFFFSFIRKKHIYTLHGVHFMHYNFFKKILFLFFEKITNKFLVDALICVGKDDFELIKKTNLINKEKLFLVENGININEYKDYQNKKIKEELGLKDKIIITTICRFHYQKDLETLIKAIKLLENENIVLLMVGDGPDRLKLEKLVKDLNLKEKVLFLGFRKDVKEILADTDIFVLSTRWEGLPIVILEAWAMKKPVIASNVHGIKGILKNDVNGLLFTLSNEKDLAEKIKILIYNKEIKNKLIENAYKDLTENYLIEKTVGDYKKIYENLIYENSSS